MVIDSDQKVSKSSSQVTRSSPIRCTVAKPSVMKRKRGPVEKLMMIAWPELHRVRHMWIWVVDSKASL